MEGGFPGGEESAVLDALARIDELRVRGFEPARIAELMAVDAAPVPAGGSWSVDKVERILEVFDSVRQSGGPPETAAPVPSSPIPVRSPLPSSTPAVVEAEADADDRPPRRSPVRMAVLGALLAGSGAGGFLAIDAVVGMSRSESRGVEATGRATTTSTLAPAPTTVAPNPADTMAIRIETDQTDQADSVAGEGAEAGPAPATATIRSDGRLYIEGAFATAKEATTFVEGAGSVFGRENIVESYVVDESAPAPQVADVGLDKPVLFESGTAVIDPDYIAFLEACAGVLELNPHIVLSITAYTDSRGSEDFNLALSQRRAQAIVDFYRERQISDEQLVAVGAGEIDPVAPNETDDGRSANRRAMLELLNVVSDQATELGS